MDNSLKLFEVIDKLTPEECALQGSTIGACLTQLGEEVFDRLVVKMIAELLSNFSADATVNPMLLDLVVQRIIATHRHTKVEEIGKALSEQIQGRGIKIYGALTPMAVIEIIHAYLEFHGDVYERYNSRFKEPYDGDRGQLDAGEERLKHQLARTQYLNELDMQKEQEKQEKKTSKKSDDKGEGEFGKGGAKA